MPGNGLNFCTAIHPELPPPKRHLVLRVRAHHMRGWTLQGDRAEEIGHLFGMARSAVRAVRHFVRRWDCTANVTVYTPSGDVFKIVEIIRP